jgi:hypothetical protein
MQPERNAGRQERIVAGRTECGAEAANAEHEVCSLPRLLSFVKTLVEVALIFSNEPQCNKWFSLALISTFQQCLQLMNER